MASAAREEGSTSTAKAQALPFPNVPPSGFPMLDREPDFDAARHLQIERPEEVRGLSALGYDEAAIAACPTPLAITSPFRILSDEGAACLIEVCRSLEPYARGIERISRMVRGGAYQSRFLRDLCTAPELTEAVSDLCGAPMLPHTIPHQLGHLNYAPKEVGENVDKWHADTLRVDFVMFVTDPQSVEGGEFEWFEGTVEEVRALKEQGKALPADRIHSVRAPGPGWAVLQQGNMVVHRAKGLNTPGERITMVNGYVPADPAFPDFTRFDQLFLADPEHVASAEYARHAAWLGRERLRAGVEALGFTDDREALAAELEAVAAMLTGAAGELRRAGEAGMEHFGDG